MSVGSGEEDGVEIEDICTISLSHRNDEAYERGSLNRSSVERLKQKLSTRSNMNRPKKGKKFSDKVASGEKLSLVLFLKF